MQLKACKIPLKNPNFAVDFKIHNLSFRQKNTNFMVYLILLL